MVEVVIVLVVIILLSYLLRFGTGKVISKNQSRIIVKLSGEEGVYAIKTLEIPQVSFKELEADKARKEETFEVDDEVKYCNLFHRFI